MGFKERYDRVMAEVAECCKDCGRDPREVRVVAVSKTVGPEEVAEAVAAGATDFGENRPDQLVLKQSLYPQQNWHFIGNIQSRRIADIVPNATMIHSLYQEHHLARIEAAAVEAGKVQDVLLEVNVSGEESKSGLAPEQVEGMLKACAPYEHIQVCGLMTMAPQGDLAAARECFEGLAHLRDDLRRKLPAERAAKFNELSMGMSEDWREGIAAGATMIRIGRVLFDESFEDAQTQR